jgi:hypothetical protein
MRKSRFQSLLSNATLCRRYPKLLEDQYVRYRQEMRERAKKGGAPAVPITVRQLEAITRVSESLARVRGSFLHVILQSKKKKTPVDGQPVCSMCLGVSSESEGKTGAIAPSLVPGMFYVLFGVRTQRFYPQMTS